MTQYLVSSLHRAVRGRSYALTDRMPGRRETLDVDIKTFAVPDGVSLREAITRQEAADKPPRDVLRITNL